MSFVFHVNTLFLENSRLLFRSIYCVVLTHKDPKIAAVQSNVAFSYL